MTAVRLHCGGGRLIDPSAPDPAAIRLTDIARALSRQPRFCGLAGPFLSVAEHCVFAVGLAEAAGITGRSARRAILLHDAHEAYLGDLPRPVRRLVPGYDRLAAALDQAIARRFDLGDYYGLVARFDDLALAHECRLMDVPCDWPDPGPLPEAAAPEFLEPPAAETVFLSMADDLGLSDADMAG